MEILKADAIFGDRCCHVAQTVLHPHSTSALHGHDFYELFIIESGTLKHLLNGGAFICRKNDLWLVRPEDAHCFKEELGHQVGFINLAFRSDAFEAAQDLFRRCSPPADMPRRAQLNPLLCTAMVEKMRILANTGRNPESLLVEILFEALRRLTEAEENYSPYWLKEACKEMEKKENYIRGLEAFLTLCGKTQEHLNRCMRRYYGTTPTEFVNNLRLAESAGLIRNTAQPVLDILYECGFNSVPHYNKLFKQKYGLSPLKYRQTNLSVIHGSQQAIQNSVR